MKQDNSLRIIVTAENRAEFLSIAQLVSTYLQMGRTIPSAIVTRLYEILYDEKAYTIQQRWSEAETVSSIAIDRMNQITDYQFSWKSRTLPVGNESYSPDTKQIFSELIYAFSTYCRDYPSAGKDEAIAFMYQAFEEQYKSEIIAEAGVEFSHRKQSIVSGILAQAQGYHLGTKKDMGSEDIFQATRNAIEKYKTRKDLFS